MWKEISSEGAQGVKTGFLLGAWIFYPFPKWSPGSNPVSVYKLLALLLALITESTLKERLE